MASMTAVELGADMCALARTNVRRADVELVAAETLDPAAFPGIDAFTSALRQTRKSLKLPRRCRAVVWGLPDGATRRDPSVTPLIAPLVGAGFRVERIISPCNALAALARLKTPRGDSATCWLAINRTGVAIIVVRPGKQLYSHSFAWDSNVGSLGSQARLLQRYSLVAFLAPEIRRAMAAARERDTSVDAIVTCGNLPEIRSLTMPLIEELDVEVESLDTFDGLVVKSEASDRLSEVAASLRIACAGAIARPTRPRKESGRPAALRSFARVAAAAAIVGGVGFIGWSWWQRQTPPRPAKPTTAATAMPKSPPVSNQTPAVTRQQTPAVTPPPALVKQPSPVPVGTGVSTPSGATEARKPAQPKASVVIEARKPPESKPPAVSETRKSPESKASVGSEARKPVDSKLPAVSEALKPVDSKPPAVV